MKKAIPIILRFCTITLSILFTVVSNLIHQWSARSFNLTAEYLVNPVFIIITAVLLGLSIVKFPLNSKTGKIVTAILIVLGLAIGYILLNFVGVPYVAVFVCVVFATELLCRGK